MFARYTGAWQEYSQRINARHQIINMWLVASTGLIIYFAKEQLSTDLATAIALALPIIAIAMFLLLGFHDCIMQKLSDYMRACELHNNNPALNSEIQPLPSYRCDPEFADGFIGIRFMQNLVLALVSVVLWFSTYFVDSNRRASSKATDGLLPTWAPSALAILWLAAILINFWGIFYRWNRCRIRDQRHPVLAVRKIVQS